MRTKEYLLLFTIAVLSYLESINCLKEQVKDKYVNAKAWQAASPDGHPTPDEFPETALLDDLKKPSTAVGFSGGGARAYAAAVGQIAGLTELGLIPKVRYIGGVSGGAWATSAYSWNQIELGDEILLGKIVDPEDIRYADLSQMHKNCMRAATREQLTRIVFNYLLKVDGLLFKHFADAWQYATQQMYLDPRGIPRGALFAYSNESIAEIKARNPFLENATFIALTNEARPFPIITGTMMGPDAGAPYQPNNFNFTRIEFTPIYSGDLAHYNVTYQYASGEKHTRLYGGAVESFGFPVKGSAPERGLSEGVSEGDLKVPMPERFTDLAYISGMSSFAPASVMTKIKLTAHNNAWKGTYWSPSNPRPNSAVYHWGDGGIIGNTPLLSFLQRGVKNIVLFFNVEVPLLPHDIWNVTEEPQLRDAIENALPEYFGVYPQKTSGIFNMFGELYERGNHQVFKREEYDRVIQGLQASQAEGRSPIFAADLETVENQAWRIKAGTKCKVLFVYLGRSTLWEKSLSEDMHHRVTNPRDLHSKKRDGEFEGFPFFATTGGDIDFPQANLLADLAGWIVKNNSVLFHEFLQ
jgi:predicted acylesterase/phospholipase RssA